MRSLRSTDMDFGLLAGVLALLAIGLPAIYSASHIDRGAGEVVRQAIWAVAGMGVMVIFALVDYRVWSRFWRVFYLLTLLALLAVLRTPEINGAHSWFSLGHNVRLQPSEFAKVIMILAFAALLVRLGPSLHTLPVFLRSVLFFFIPIGLVLIQPDFGTACVLFTVWFAMTWLSGVRWWLPVGVVVALGLLLVFAWNVHVGGHDLIKPYQKRRLDFINADPSGPGYHQRQARIAIGSGKFWGKGFLHGSQGQLRFLPENDTDFIFAVIGEEFGFLGCLVVLGLYLFVVFRLLRIAEEAETLAGRVIAAGVAAMLAVHAVINIGMNLTLMPVTGIPLPFISYGGSSLLADFAAIGLAMNVSRHRQSQRHWAAAEEELVRV